MKTKRFLMKSLVAVAFAAFIITGCKKKEHEVEPENPATTPTETTQTNTAADQNNVDQQTSESVDDVNKVLNNNPNTRAELPCNVTIDSSALMGQGLIKLTYHGLSCDLLRTRSGVISIQVPFDAATKKPISWRNKGAKVIITYDNFKVTRVSDNKSLLFNGKLTATNVTGGGVFEVLIGSTVTHDLRGGLTITFDDGSTRQWAVARTRSYKPQVGVITVQDSGDTLINGKKVAWWGKNRANEEFWASIDKPVSTEVVTLSICRLYKPYEGVVTIATTSSAPAIKQLVITYGVDANGNPTTGSACPYGYKLNFNDATGAAKQLIIKYL
jgi:hypothetical protein